MVAGRDARYVGPVFRLLRVEREGSVRVRRAGRREGPGDDDLGARETGVSLGESGRVRVAGGLEERVVGLDPLVDDPDLHALARVGEIGAPELRRADQGRRPVERCVKRAVRPDVRDAGNAPERRHTIARDDDGHPVRDDRVPPARLGRRDRAPDPRRDRRLRRIEPA